MSDMNALWRKSSYSGGSGGQCVEVGQSTSVLVRDSKTNGTGPVLALPSESWRAFLHSLRA